MTDFFNTSINMHCTKESDISVSDCLNEFYKGSLVVDLLTGVEQRWYLTGYSRKEASKYIVFDDGKPSLNAIDIFERHYKKNHPLVNESIWNGKPDGVSCSISHFMKFINNPKKSNLIIELDQRVKKTEDMINSLCLLAKGQSKSWIMVDSKGYWLNDQNVFPDRIYVGWMLYIPNIVLANLLPQAAKVIPVIDGEEQKGTIVVSTEDIFDGSNKEHIGKANDLEIRLLDLGLLPLITEL